MYIVLYYEPELVLKSDFYPNYGSLALLMNNYCSFAFFYKNLKNAPVKKKLSEGATACLFYLPLQALVATITELKARAGTIFRNCEKSNDGGNPWKR